MDNKHFNVNYETIKDLIRGIVFVVLLWGLISNYFEELTSPSFFEPLIGELPFSMPVQLLGVIIVVVILILIIYLLAISSVELSYWFFGYKTSQTKWYPYLTELDIKIPLTKNYYWKIKDNPKFTYKFGKDIKPDFSHDKLNDWASKIIEKEIDNLVKGKIMKEEIGIPLKEKLQWGNLK